MHSPHFFPWFDGMLSADEQHNEPLFSSHMLDPRRKTAHLRLFAIDEETVASEGGPSVAD